ncbi:MAG TPA: class I SAM-dependent RNA methyltransferase, partial [Longimicrobiaceae bacterium]|nr:class I SAM-dependent RNA methyltransferase [Longimicrobiaceae bacterium]
MSSADERFPLFAVTAPGLEELCAHELRWMGIAGVAEPGGVVWEGTRAELYDANLRLRLASRVLVRVAEFRARTFFELERHARKVPWEQFVAPGGTVRLRVSSRKSKLYHEGAIAQRLLDAVERSVGGLRDAGAAGGGDEEDEGAEGQLFVVRFHYDRCTVSADASGALLHLRGYRQALAKAPLRETLAAAMLLGSGWDGSAPLLDPMCGSGTVAIEGALLARRIAPGLASAERAPRRYAFLDWPDFDTRLWAGTVERAAGEVLAAAPAPIQGSDRDAGAVEAARSNAARAGVLDDLALDVCPLSAVASPPGTGWLLSNPPYGVRVGETEGLRNLYAALGRLAREKLPGWTLGLLSADRGLEAQVKVRFAEAL